MPVRVSQMPDANELVGNEKVHVIQDGLSKGADIEDVKLYANYDNIIYPAVAASNTLTITGPISSGETVSIDSFNIVYEAGETISNESLENIILNKASEINIPDFLLTLDEFISTGVPTLSNIEFHNITISDSFVSNVTSLSTIEISASIPGLNGNLLTTTETLSNGEWDNSTLTGGTSAIYAYANDLVGYYEQTPTSEQRAQALTNLGLSNTSSSLSSHTSDTNNPHNVTASQVGLSAVDNTSDADKPISTDTQVALDTKSSTAALSSHTSDTNNPHNVTATQIGLSAVDNTSDADKPISTDTQAALDAKASTVSLSSHTDDTTNPHNVTASQVGLSAVDNTSDIDKPISTATQTALDTKASTVSLSSHTDDTTNPHNVTATQIGLSAVDNTSDADKPISTDTQAALDAKASTVSLSSHTSDTNNPHNVTASQVGLSAVDNTSDIDKPISTATQTALDAKASTVSLSSHTTNTANPHNVTATQVGLSAVDNTSDADKPISTATQTALDLKASTVSLSSHTTNTANPHSVTATQVGLSAVDNTSDADKPISTATQTALDLKANQSTTYTKAEVDANITSLVDAAPAALDTLNELAAALGDDENFATNTANSIATKANQTDLDTHTTDTSNPHGVTATQVGLSAVDNTSDSDKPISTATQTALDLKANDTDLTSHTTNTANPHSVTATQVGLSAVDNTSDVDKPISIATQTALDTHTTDTSNPHSVTATQVGLSAVDNTSDVDKPISTATQSALDLKANDTDLTSHTTDTSNPHSVTATQVGLSAVDNTSDVDKPISTATQAGLDGKQDLLTVSDTAPASPDAGDLWLDSTQAKLYTYYNDGDSSQWVSVNSGTATPTAASIGLGNVDNTADANKPVSTAQQAAINNSSLTLEESAGLVPFRLPANVSPFTDPDADAIISSTSTTDERGINHYHRIVHLFKGLNVWSSLQDAYLIGDKWQSSSATLKSITGNNDATGSCTFNDYFGAFNGSSNGYTFTNDDQGAAKTSKTFFAIFKNTAKAIGSLQTSTLLSNYEGGSKKGLALSAARFGGFGASNLPDISCIGSTNGSDSTTAAVDNANDYKYSVAIATVKDGSMNLFAHAFNPNRQALATLHNNNATYGLGKNANNSYHFNGEIVFAGVLDSGISDYQAFALRLGLESILSDVIDWPASIVFEGNSLTGQASGGGTTYPSKLMAKAGWTDIKRWANVADGGAEQTQKVEAKYFTEVRQWMAITKQTSMFILWSGINDISNISGLTTHDLTASLERSIKRAKAEGFWVGILPLTPVANAGDGLTYGYSTAQQTLLTETNSWIEHVGADLADQFIDIRKIGETYPEFLDPTDDTYYTTGDGLHHNDAGRALIASKIDTDVSYPTL